MTDGKRELLEQPLPAPDVSAPSHLSALAKELSTLADKLVAQTPILKPSEVAEELVAQTPILKPSEVAEEVFAQTRILKPPELSALQKLRNLAAEFYNDAPESLDSPEAAERTRSVLLRAVDEGRTLSRKRIS